jgi:hypothetical protein
MKASPQMRPGRPSSRKSSFISRLDPDPIGRDVAVSHDAIFETLKKYPRLVTITSMMLALFSALCLYTLVAAQACTSPGNKTDWTWEKVQYNFGRDRGWVGLLTWLQRAEDSTESQASMVPMLWR